MSRFERVLPARTSSATPAIGKYQFFVGNARNKQLKMPQKCAYDTLYESCEQTRTNALVEHSVLAPPFSRTAVTSVVLEQGFERVECGGVLVCKPTGSSWQLAVRVGRTKRNGRRGRPHRTVGCRPAAAVVVCACPACQDSGSQLLLLLCLKSVYCAVTELNSEKQQEPRKNWTKNNKQATNKLKCQSVTVQDIIVCEKKRLKWNKIKEWESRTYRDTTTTMGTPKA